MSQLVRIEDGHLICSVNDVDEAKAAIVELKNMKSELAIRKGELSLAMRVIRADHRETAASLSRPSRGGGSFGRFLRGVHSSTQQDLKDALTRELAPLQDEKFQIERKILQIEKVIVQLKQVL